MCARSLVITTAMTRSAAPLANSARGDLLDHPGLGALAHPDQDGAVADRLHVAALERGPAEVVRRRSGRRRPSWRVPVLEVGVGEHRVVAVDRGDVVGLEPAGRPEHRVDRDPAVDPARRVAGEQGVRQRRQHEHARRRPERRPASDRRAGTCRGRARTRRRSGRRSGAWRAARASSPHSTARTSSTSDRPTVYSDAASSISLRRPSSLAASASPSRSWSRKTSTPRSRILATNWSCSYCARSTHSTSSNSRSSWLVGVSRCRLSSGPVHHHLAQPADLRVDAERCHRLLRSGRPVVTGHHLGAGRRRRRSARSASSAPIAARPPVASTNRQAASTFGPIEPAGKLVLRAARRPSPVPAPAAAGVPQSAYTASTSVAMHEQVGRRPRGPAARWRGPCR